MFDALENVEKCKKYIDKLEKNEKANSEYIVKLKRQKKKIEQLWNGMWLKYIEERKWKESRKKGNRLKDRINKLVCLTQSVNETKDKDLLEKFDDEFKELIIEIKKNNKESEKDEEQLGDDITAMNWEDKRNAKLLELKLEIANKNGNSASGIQIRSVEINDKNNNENDIKASEEKITRAYSYSEQIGEKFENKKLDAETYYHERMKTIIEMEIGLKEYEELIEREKYGNMLDLYFNRGIDVKFIKDNYRKLSLLVFSLAGKTKNLDLMKDMEDLKTRVEKTLSNKTSDIEDMKMQLK